MTTEKDNARAILLALQSTTARLFRNNTGTGWVGESVKRWRDEAGNEYLTLKNPRPLHAGLVKGGGDYIGWTATEITPEMVGQSVAVFTSIETKRSRSARRTPEQKHFCETVKEAGGRAGFATTPQEALTIIYA